MAFDKDAIIASLKEASISDLNDLVKAIEEEFDVSAAAPVAVAGAAGGDAAAKDSFTVELTEPGSAKVKVIKAVKDITGVGLKDAKDLVDGAPSAIKEDVKEDEANDIKEKLEDRKSTRLNSSHVSISYAVFCLKKKKQLYVLRIQYTVSIKVNIR